jgi:hypothetical protein
VQREAELVGQGTRLLGKRSFCTVPIGA